jgi:YVTN family beta-propeller protein
LDRPFLVSLSKIAKNDEAILSEIHRIEEMSLNDYDSWNKLGTELTRKGLYAEAIQCYERALQINPDYIEASLNRGLALYSQGKYEEAIKSYDRTINIDPNNVDAWLNRGLALYSQGKYEEAIKSYDRVIEIDPNNVDAWLNRGLALYSQGKYEEAIKSYDRTINIDPNNVNAWLRRSDSLYHQGKYEEAIKSYDRVIEIDPNNVNALNGKALALEGLDNYEEAEHYYNRVREVYKNTIDILTDLADSDYSKERYEEAIKYYDRVIEIDPNNVDAWLRRSDSLYHQGKYEEAIKSYDRTINIDPDNVNVNALNGKALALEGLDNYEEAIKLFNQAIENDPNNLDALNNKADALIIMREYEEAQGCYMKVLQIDPKNLVALVGLHLLYSNYTFEFDRAISIAQRLLMIQDIPKFKSYLASDLICSGRFRKGRGIAKKLAYLLPEGGIKGELIARFLVLISYFLQGNKHKGNAEATKLIGYYRDLDVNVVIQERERLWSSKGLINTIRSNKKIDPNTKSVLYQFIELLQGERYNKTLKTIAKSFDEALKEKRKQRDTSLKILLSLSIVGIATVVLIWAIWNTIFFPQAKACPEEGSAPMLRAELDQYPSSITFDPKNDRLYVVNKAGEISGATTDSDNSSITVICVNNNQEIKDESIRGMAGVSGVAVNPNTSTTYVVNNPSNTVLVIDGDSNTEPKNIRVGESPIGIAVDADRNKAYVVNEKSKTVSVIDEDTKIGQDIPLKHSPTSITVNPNTGKVYVGSYENNTVYVIDGRSNTIEPSSIKVEGINSTTAIAVNPNTNMIYVVNRFSDSVSVINGTNNQVIERVVVGQDPLDIAINSRNNMVYVVDNRSLSISVINGASSGDNNVIQTLSLGKRLSRDFIDYDPTSIEIDPNTDTLFVAMADRSSDNSPRLQDHGVESLFVRNISGYGDELPLGDQPRGLALDAQGHALYVTNSHSNTISVVDTQNNVVNETIPVGEYPVEVFIDQGKERIYVANCRSNTISVVDTQNNVVNETIPVDTCPWSIAQDPDYDAIYVANAKSTTVSVINSSTAGVVKNITVGANPTDIWVNPDTHLVYVTVTRSNFSHVIKPDFSSAREPSFQIVKNITAPSSFAVSRPVNVAVDHNMGKAYIANLNSSSIWVVDEKTAIFDQVYIPLPNVLTVDTNHHIVYALAGHWSREFIQKSNFYPYPYEIYKINASATGPAEVSLIHTWEKNATQLADLEVDPDSGTLYATNIKSNSLKIIPPTDLGSTSDLQNRELSRFK